MNAYRAEATESGFLGDFLRNSARGHRDAKALNLYATALEIDCVQPAPTHRVIAAEIRERWTELTDKDWATLRDAKLNLVRRFGDAARTVSHRGRTRSGQSAPAYRQLFEIGCCERSFAGRLAAALEIGAGGDEALTELAEILGSPLNAGEPVQNHARNSREQQLRRNVMRAWLAPLLVGSAAERERTAQALLEEWLEFLRSDCRSGRAGPGLTLEVAMAQGFKYAANRRRGHPHTRDTARTYLAEKAKELLHHTRFWFTQLTLVQALCLWELPDHCAGRHAGYGRHPEYEASVAEWCSQPGHPFVAEACRLTVRALETGQPERFVWIDESAAVSQPGSRPARSRSLRSRDLWIPPSTGWAALHPHAQRLVADVLVLLSLIERGDPSEQAGESARRILRTNQDSLPPCLTDDRSFLEPARTVGTVVSMAPGSSCKDGCLFGLCPYPPKDIAVARLELSEAFCRRQQDLAAAGWLRPRNAPWQRMRSSNLQRFWEQMRQRAMS